MHSLREWLALWLLEWAVRLLPVSSSTRRGMLRGLMEQRSYDRYQAHCWLDKTEPLPFRRWREVSSWLRVKADAAEQANAVLRASGRAWFRPAISRL